jgi:hypothetical protein
MRVLFLIAALWGALGATDAQAQIYLSGRNNRLMRLDTMSQVQYINVNIWRVPFSSKVRIFVDCGQSFDVGGDVGGCELVDKKGEGIRFETRMAVFNFLYQQGWLYKNTFLQISGGSSDERHIFERRRDVPPANGDGY